MGNPVVVAACMALVVLGAQALTTPQELAQATALRDALSNRSSEWRNAMKTWTCPTDPSSSDAACDICSNDWSGNWEHLHCRGFAGPYGEGSVGDRDGLITTVHITDVNLDGPVPRQFCKLHHLREFDLDGGQLTGPFPRWFTEPYPVNSTSNSNSSQCLPAVQELDLSYNRLIGTIPPEIGQKARLQEFKVEHNYLTGSVPADMADLPDLWRVRLSSNKLSGSIPAAWSKMGSHLNELWMDNNNFEGDLSALGSTRLTYVLVHNNAKLCGMVPASVMFAHGYDPAGTRLGQPC